LYGMSFPRGSAFLIDKQEVLHRAVGLYSMCIWGRVVRSGGVSKRGRICI
jgi:hypothetical protein